MMRVGMPDPSQMPQQQMMLPPAPKQPEMVVDVLGIRVPAEMLGSPAFWIFLAVCVATVLGVAYLKYARRDGK